MAAERAGLIPCAQTSFLHTYTHFSNSYLHSAPLDLSCAAVRLFFFIITSLSLSQAHAHTFIHSQATQTPSLHTDSLSKSSVVALHRRSVEPACLPAACEYSCVGRGDWLCHPCITFTRSFSFQSNLNQFIWVFWGWKTKIELACEDRWCCRIIRLLPFVPWIGSSYLLLCCCWSWTLKRGWGVQGWHLKHLHLKAGCDQSFSFGTSSTVVVVVVRSQKQ